MTSPVVDVDRLDALVTRHLDGRVPGGALAVVRSGETVFSRCHGMADLEWRQPVTPTTVFRLASLSKPFTALTAMLLARDGLLDLDAPVSRYLSHPLPHAGTVRVRHLLSHTSGIPNFVVQPSFAGRTSRIDHTDEEVVARFASLPLHFEPGSRYSYNNSAYRLLDMVVAGVTGGSFADALTERVLAPAGMTDTRVLSDQEIVPERARGYDADGPDGFANAPYVSMTLPGGAGGMGSTLRDLARFDRALSAGVVADEQMQRRLFQPVTLTGGRSEGYGLGWGLSTYRGRRVVHHAGGIEGFSCLYARVPDADLGVVLLTNLHLYSCAGLVRRVLDVVLDLPRPDHQPVLAPQADPRRRVGTYTDHIHDIEITAEPGRLVVSTGGETLRMVPLDPATYVDSDDADVVLRFHDDEPTPACTLHHPLHWLTVYRT